MALSLSAKELDIIKQAFTSCADQSGLVSLDRIAELIHLLFTRSHPPAQNEIEAPQPASAWATLNGVVCQVCVQTFLSTCAAGISFDQFMRHGMAMVLRLLKGFESLNCFGVRIMS